MPFIHYFFLSLFLLLLCLFSLLPPSHPLILTVDGDGSQYDPGGPLGQELNEDEGHECADDDEIGLLQMQGPLPVDTHHAHRPEVPDDHDQRWIVHRNVVRLEHLTKGGVPSQGELEGTGRGK